MWKYKNGGSRESRNLEPSVVTVCVRLSAVALDAPPTTSAIATATLFEFIPAVHQSWT